MADNIEKRWWPLPIAALLLLLAAATVPYFFPERVGSDLAQFAVAVVVSVAVCFLGVVGLIGWYHYLDSKKSDESDKQIAALKEAQSDLQRKIVRLLSEANESKALRRKLQQLSEDLQSDQDDASDSVTQKTEKAVLKIRNFIIQNFPKS